MPLDAPAAEPFRRIAAGRHEILVGDCLDAMRAVPAASFDCAVTSPPYNLGIAYGSYGDRRPRADYLAWLAEVSAALARALKPGGSLFLNLGGSGADPWLPMDAAAAFRGDFRLQNHIVWAKSVSVGGDTAGHFKPVNSPRYLNRCHEAVFHLTKTGAAPIDRLAVGVAYKDKGNVARFGAAGRPDRRCAGDVWFVPYETVRSRAQKFHHPSGFPVALAERCLRLHGGGPGASVLDPFLGAGSTLVAAERLGWRGAGVELDTGYAETAAARLAAEAGRTAPAAAGPGG